MAWDATHKIFNPDLPESLWIIEHGLNTSVPAIDLWVKLDPTKEEYTAMIPLETRVVDNNTVHISFSSPMLGTAKLY